MNTTATVELNNILVITFVFYCLCDDHSSTNVGVAAKYETCNSKLYTMPNDDARSFHKTEPES